MVEATVITTWVLLGVSQQQEASTSIVTAILMATLRRYSERMLRIARLRVPTIPPFTLLMIIVPPLEAMTQNLGVIVAKGGGTAPALGMLADLPTEGVRWLFLSCYHRNMLFCPKSEHLCRDHPLFAIVLAFNACGLGHCDHLLINNELFLPH